MIIASVDLGKARTGIAVCDKMEFLASPLPQISEKNMDVLLEKIAVIAKGVGDENIITMCLIFLCAGAFSGTV